MTFCSKERGIVALLDINDFKEINDRFGHDEGDRYLIRFAELLSRCFGGVAGLYRIGGDEFVLLAKKDNIETFETALQKARDAAKKNGIEFACGYRICNKRQPVDDVLKEVDRLMYENKSRMKKYG